MYILSFIYKKKKRTGRWCAVREEERSEETGIMDSEECYRGEQMKEDGRGEDEDIKRGRTYEM